MRRKDALKEVSVTNIENVERPCAYGKDPELTGHCDGPLTGRVRGYYANGNDLVLCVGHVRRWNKLHPMGPKAIITKK